MKLNSKTMKKDGRKKTTPGKEHVFSVDLKSRTAIRNASLDDGKHDGVLIEGTLGILKHAEFMDGVVLEIAGENGVLRVDLARDDLAKHAQKTEGDGANW